MFEYTLKFNTTQLQVIWNTMSKLPYDEVASVLFSIEMQAKAQEEEAGIQPTAADIDNAPKSEESAA